MKRRVIQSPIVGAMPSTGDTGFSAEAPFTCQNLQADLDDHFSRALLSKNRRKENAFINFLKSPRNMSPIRETLERKIQQNGIKRKVTLRFDKPMCLQLCKGDWSCGDDTTDFMVQAYEREFDVTDEVYYFCGADGKPLKITWDFEEWTKLCREATKGGQKQFFQKKVSEALLDFEEQINNKLLAQFAELIGCHAEPADGSKYTHTMPLFGDTSLSPFGMPNPHAISEIDDKYEDAYIKGRYAVFGGRDFKNYMRVKGYSGMAFTGTDFSKVPEEFDFYYDQDMNKLYGTDAWFTIPYGAVQIVQYRENSGERQVDYPQVKKMTTRTPRGLSVDMTWQHVVTEKCNQISVSLSANISTVAMPAQETCNEIAGCVNGVYLFRNCKKLEVSCPADYVEPDTDGIGSREKICDYVVPFDGGDGAYVKYGNDSATGLPGVVPGTTTDQELVAQINSTLPSGTILKSATYVSGIKVWMVVFGAAEGAKIVMSSDSGTKEADECNCVDKPDQRPIPDPPKDREK